jgi:hypothetical protein
MCSRGAADARGTLSKPIAKKKVARRGARPSTAPAERAQPVPPLLPGFLVTTAGATFLRGEVGS